MSHLARATWTVVLTAASFLVGCGVDPDIEDLVTIEQGVYGQTTYYNDTVPTSHTYESYPLKIFVAPRGETAPVAEVTSGKRGRGFYEVALSPGDYEICTGNKCTDFTVVPNEVVRVDYEAPFWLPDRL